VDRGPHQLSHTLGVRNRPMWGYVDDVSDMRMDPTATGISDPDATSIEQTVGGKDPATAKVDRPQEALDAQRRFEHDPPQAFTDEDAYRMELITSAIGAPEFPTTREAVLDIARANNAQDAVISDLKSLPDGSTYSSLDELMLALGIGTAGRIDVAGAPPRDPDGGAPSLPR